MQMRSRPFAPCAALVLLLAGRTADAQHTTHGSPASGPDSAATLHVMGQALPLVTRADPTAGQGSRTEASLSQALVMARASWWRGRAHLDATLDAEGLTMRRGELSTGAFGEGFVDRRHPHTYLHELMLTGLGRAGAVAFSASVGRGFAPFGTDDPMTRPFAKYPINHHLAQILERGALIGAVRVGAVIVEGGVFTGEEPLDPSSLPRAERFGDSRAARVTLALSPLTEVQGSLAHVRSPEQVQGFGLDQRKRSVSARWITPDGGRYLLAEWARTVDRDPTSGADAFAYESALAEGSVVLGPVGVALRLEQTGRPEEERVEDPFRVGRPATDLSISGITRWRAATLHVAGRPVTARGVSGVPFMEVAHLFAASGDPRAPFDPVAFYGRDRFWMFTTGVRLRVGPAHARMGRYGVAAVSGPAIGTLARGASVQHVH